MVNNTNISIFKAITKFFELLKFDRKDISAIYFFAVLGGLISLSLPLGIQYIISFVQANSISVSIVLLIFIVLVGVFVSGLLQIRQMEIIEKIEQKIFVRYALEFADRIPKLDVEQLDNYHLPELVNRFFDSTSLIKSIEKILLDIPTAIIQIFFGLVLLSFYHPVFIAFGALLVIVLTVIIKYTSPRGFETSLKASDYKYSIAAWFQEMAAEIKTFKYARSGNIHIKKADEDINGYLIARTQHFRILVMQYWSFISFKIIIVATMLIVGSVLLINQQINIGQFIASDIVIILIINSIEKLIQSLDKVYDTLTAVEKLSKVVHAPIEREGSLLIPNSQAGMQIAMHQVNFTYPDGKLALKQIEVNIPAGALVQLCGESGSGKSSFLRLLTGAFQHYTGNILIDGMPINNYQLADLRSKTGILFSRQDVFKGTLLENITMNDATINAQDVLSLAKQIGFYTYISELPLGLYTPIDPIGKRLSQKVKKDILLMRALIGNARLLLLEEPCAHKSDEEIEKLLKFLSSKKQHTTIIITTEAPMKKSFFDIFIQLQNGEIVIMEEK
jgi:ABC-type bacteriocin/lantibiotic exporter with double-glycine peptidase domain